MTRHLSRRRVVQTALATAAVAAAPASRSLARQSTPTADDGAAVTPGQVEAALARLDDLITDAMTRTGVPGAAVAVVYDDAVVYERGFGVRELGKAEPITPETVFQIASLAKPISSTLVAAVVGDGLTTWDATISSLEPGFALADPWVSDQIALSDLFSHRSGLPAYGGDKLINLGYDREECIDRLRFVPLATPFRTTYAYNNLGVAVAGFAAARAAGHSWEDLADKRLLAPLGMSNISYRYADFGLRDNRATPHIQTPDGAWTIGDPYDADAAAPAGGVSSNVRDLTRWLRLQLGGGVFEGERLVASEPLWETHRPHSVVESSPDPAAAPLSFYGLGWSLQYDDRGRLLVYHGGDFANGFRTGAYLLPAAGLGIVVLTNSWPNPLRDAIPRAFLETVTHGEPLKDWVGTIETETNAALAALVASAPPVIQGEPPADATPPLPLDVYVGTYTNQLYGEVNVSEAQGGLMMELGPQPRPYPLRHWDRDTFGYSPSVSDPDQLPQLGVVFMIGLDGTAEAVAVNLDGGGEADEFKRLANP